MLAIGAVFSTRDEAVRARDALLARGVLPEEMTIEPVEEPFWRNLVDVDLPAEEAVLYEPYVPGSTSMLIVRTTRLSTDEIDDVIRAHRGLVVRAGVAPPLADVPLPTSEER